MTAPQTKTEHDDRVLAMRLPDLDDGSQPGGRFVKRAVTLTLATIGGLVLVSVLVALLVSMDVTIKAQGVLEPVRVWPVRSLVSGSVAEVAVRSGDTVAAGQVLLRLDAMGLEAQLAQLEAQQRAAASDRERALAGTPIERRQAAERRTAAQTRLTTARAALLQRMVEHGFGTSVDSLLAAYRPGGHVVMDQAVGEVRAAESDLRLNAAESDMLALRSYDDRRAAAEMERLTAQIEEVRARIARTELRSPGAGVVLTEQLERLQGSFVGEGQTLMEVAERGEWRVTMGVTERDVNRIQMGDPVRLEVLAFAERDRRQLQGRVVHVAGEVGSAGEAGAQAPLTPGMPGTYRVVAELDPGQLDPGSAERLRRGYTVEANVVTRSGRIAELAWESLMEKLNRR